VVERRSSLGLAHQAGGVRGIDRVQRVGDNLDDNSTLHQHVLGEIDAGRPADSKVPGQLVLSQEEPFPAAFQQLAALPVGQEAEFDQLPPDELGVVDGRD